MLKIKKIATNTSFKIIFQKSKTLVTREILFMDIFL